MILSNTHWLSLALLIFTTITLAVLWHRSRKNTLPPGPRGLPVVGYLPFLDPNLHQEFTKIAKRYGPIFKLMLGSRTHIVVSSLELAKVVVHEQDEVFSNRAPSVAALILTYGGQDILFSNNNSYWRNLRKVLVSEVLSNRNLEASRTFRLVEVRKTIKHVYETMDSEVDIGEIAFLTSLNVLTNMLWGKSLVEDEKNRNLGSEFREVIFRLVELIGMANVSDFFPMLSRFDLQGVERESKKALKRVDDIFERIIEERIAMKQEEAIEQHGRKDFLEILLELKDQNNATSFNITQIKALFLDTITGGTDTTATTVEWTMAELVHNPKIIKKVQDELKQVVGLNNIVEESHLPKLKYLDVVIRESLRLHPPLPLLVVRSPNQSCKVGGYTVPKGSNVYLNIWSIHRDPQYWDNPLEFNPNRFINPDETSKFNYNGLNCDFLPFGSGRRRCPAITLGEKMLKYSLASLLHSFDWTLPIDKESDLSDKFGHVMKKRNPLIAIPSQRLLDKNLYMM